jgi:hypothetical protein
VSSPEGTLFQEGAQNYGSSTYPAMLRPLRGFSASWSPFFLRLFGKVDFDAHADG